MAHKGGITLNNIIRVFPRKTSYSPDDPFAFYGPPPLPCMIPEHSAVHISCTFTWDKQNAEWLAYQWEGATNKPVLIGGPAYGSQAEDFTPGLYMRSNIIFTTRGCPNNCPWCIVPKLEGKMRELPVFSGNVIQDNNFLAASRQHKERVFDMLRAQRAICFRGGLEADLIDDHFVNNVTSLRIKELWTACDTDARIPIAVKAIEKLRKAGFSRDKVRCYCLIGDDMERNEARLQAIYKAGAIPFAQLYRDFSETKTKYSAGWNAFARMWQRPAATVAHMENGTSYKDFHT